MTALAASPAALGRSSSASTWCRWRLRPGAAGEAMCDDDVLSQGRLLPGLSAPQRAGWQALHIDDNAWPKTDEALEIMSVMVRFG